MTILPMDWPLAETSKYTLGSAMVEGPGVRVSGCGGFRGICLREREAGVPPQGSAGRTLGGQGCQVGADDGEKIKGKKGQTNSWGPFSS